MRRRGVAVSAPASSFNASHQDPPAAEPRETKRKTRKGTKSSTDTTSTSTSTQPSRVGTRGRKHKADPRIGTGTDPDSKDETEIRRKKKSKSNKEESVIMEKGRIYFFYRPKVDQEHVDEFRDIQRLYILLSPIESQPCENEEHQHEHPSCHVHIPPPAKIEGSITRQHTRYLSAHFPHRLIIIPRKILPPTTGKAKMEFALVDTVSFCMDEIEKRLDPVEFIERPYGKRRLGSARPVGEGIYELIKYTESNISHKSYVQLAYALEIPDADHMGDAQRVLNIQRAGHLMLLVGDPTIAPFACPWRKESCVPNIPTFIHPMPHHLQELFTHPDVEHITVTVKQETQRRFIPLDPPEFLNYPCTDIMMIGDGHNMSEFGVIADELITEAEREEEQERKAYDGYVEKRVLNEVHLSPKTHPVDSLTTGALV